METTKFYLGIDVSKLWFDASLMLVVDHQRQPITSQRFINDSEGMKVFKAWLKSNRVPYDANTIVVIENTGVYHRLIWSFCSKHNLNLHIGNAAHIKWSLGITRGKSDVIDSQRLCIYCFKQSEELKVSPTLNPIFMQLKDLMTSRTRLLTQLQSNKSYLNELKNSKDKLLFNTLQKVYATSIDGIKESIFQIEKELMIIINSDEKIKNNYELILSIPGIGKITAIYIICCTNNFATKTTGKQLASYAGVVPFEHSSGTSIKGKNRVHKMANKELKSLLHLCALSCIRNSEEFKNYYNRKKEEGKNGMLILNAIRNKLVLRVVAVIKKQQPYVNNYQKAA